MTTYKPFLQQYRDAIHATQEQDARIETLQTRIESLREEIPAEEKAIIDLESSLKDALLTEAALPANSTQAEAGKKAIEEGKYKEAYQMLGEIKDYILVMEEGYPHGDFGSIYPFYYTANKAQDRGSYIFINLRGEHGKIWPWTSFTHGGSYDDHQHLDRTRAIVTIPTLVSDHGKRVRVLWCSIKPTVDENERETIKTLAESGNPVTMFYGDAKAKGSRQAKAPQGVGSLVLLGEIYVLGRHDIVDVISRYAAYLFERKEKPTEGILTPEQLAEQEAQRQHQQEQEAAERERRKVEEDAQLETLLKSP